MNFVLNKKWLTTEFNSGDTQNTTIIEKAPTLCHNLIDERALRKGVSHVRDHDLEGIRQ